MGVEGSSREEAQGREEGRSRRWESSPGLQSPSSSFFPVSLFFFALSSFLSGFPASFAALVGSVNIVECRLCAPGQVQCHPGHQFSPHLFL